MSKQQHGLVDAFFDIRSPECEMSSAGGSNDRDMDDGVAYDQHFSPRFMTSSHANSVKRTFSPNKTELMSKVHG